MTLNAVDLSRISGAARGPAFDHLDRLRAGDLKIAVERPEHPKRQHCAVTDSVAVAPRMVNGTGLAPEVRCARSTGRASSWKVGFPLAGVKL